MVITKLLGGLGNQMFQYAFGRNIALKNNCDLKLDLSFYGNDEYRNYSLNHFSIVESIAVPAEIDQLKQRHFSKLNKLKRKLFNAKPYFIHEKNLEFNSQNLITQPDVYVDGYWQSEQYFANSSFQIKKDLQIKTAPSPANQYILSQIESVNAVSLHIRRGDFHQNEALNKIHGTCAMPYYQKASDFIADKTANPVFYIFSDDSKWAKQHLKLDYETMFLDINDDKSAHEDLRLMSNCQHHIIANSTFSWWGAWLNQKPDKIIIAPKTWFADPELNLKSKSIIPENWIRI